MDFIFDPSLVLYLPLYELDGASFMSRDKHGHLCTVTGALWRPNGRYFDGDDYIDLGTPASLKTTGDFTAEFWLNPASLGTNYQFWDYNYNGGVGAMLLAANNLRLYRNSFALNTDETITAAEFFHYVGSVENGTGKIYLNGELSKSGALSSAPGFPAGSWQIGQRNGGSWPYRGLIGEVRIYNRALSPLEIQHNYLATKWRYR